MVALLLMVALLFLIITLSVSKEYFQSKVQGYTFRLHPGERIVEGMVKCQKLYGLKALSVGTVVGSLTNVVIRYANQNWTDELSGHFEIVSLTGTVDEVGKHHFHISVGDENGRTISGHLVEGTIYTTAEITMYELLDVLYIRKVDPQTTYDELYIYERKEKNS